MNKYKDINLLLQPKYKKHRLQVFTIEISVLGFISNLNDFCTFFKIPNMPISIKTKIIKSVIVNSYNITAETYPGFFFRVSTWNQKWNLDGNARLTGVQATRFDAYDAMP